MTAAAPAIDLTRWIKPGDHVLIAEGAGEPQTLLEELVRQRHAIGEVTIVLGALFSKTLRPEHSDVLRLRGFGGVGCGELIRDGGMDVLPCHFSTVPRLISEGAIRVDVVLVQLSEADPEGRHSLGLLADYISTAIAAARVVLAEVNGRVPYVLGDTLVPSDRIDARVHSSRTLISIPSRDTDPVSQDIASRVAELVPDAGVLQMGIGRIPDATLCALSDRRELGIHSGMIGDGVVDLIEKGVVTNGRKEIDTGITVASVLLGTERVAAFAHNNDALRVRASSYTHDLRTISQLSRFFSVNSALEVDLTGQVNAEMSGGHYVGAVGGHSDFVRGAAASPGGRSVIALPSTARDGGSAVVAALPDSVVTTTRSDVDYIVTEFGVATLRGKTLRERARELVAVAHPAHREQLARAAGSSS